MCGGLKQSCELRGPVRTDVVRCRGRWAFLSSSDRCAVGHHSGLFLFLSYFSTFTLCIGGISSVSWVFRLLFVKSSKTDGISLFLFHVCRSLLILLLVFAATPPFSHSLCWCGFHPPLLVLPLVFWLLRLCLFLSS